MNSKTSKTLPFHIIITLSMLLIFGLLSSCASTADVVGDGDYSEDSISQNAQDGNDMMTINEIDDLFSKYEGKEIWVSDISIYVADITNSCFRANIYDECDVYIEFANNNEFNVVKALF